MNGDVGTKLELAGISASYGGTTVLRDLTLAVEPGELTALLGPSGCGKTTLLRIVAGLLHPDSGSVRFDGEAVDRRPAEQRGVGVVFQKPLLFPHMTVAENVSFGLRMRRVTGEEQSRRVAEALAMVRLEGLESRLPSELSGGQEQRVALARALVTAPRILLLDEPFSALDESLRSEMRTLVRSLQRQLGTTTVFVTHDQEEASVISDRIALLLDGRIEQYAAAREFYTEPKTLRAARFFGWETARGDGRNTVAAFRPELVSLVSAGQAAGAGEQVLGSGTVVERIDLGARLRVGVELKAGRRIVFERRSGPAIPTMGEPVKLVIATEHVKEFSNNDG